MNALFEKINNLSNTQKVIGIVVIIAIIFVIIELAKGKNKYTNVNKRSNKIEKLDNMVDSSYPPTIMMETPSISDEIDYGDISISPEKINVTLFYAEWCGHCNKFMNETWGQIKENFESNESYKLNEINCTNMKSDIKTPAGKNIEGFPTLIFNYKNKKGDYIEEEYNGPRTYDVLSTVLEKFQ